jgi:hypothetical protein
MLRTFQQVINLGPTLAANHTASFIFPFDAQLVHVSMCNSTANAGTLEIGTSSDDDAYLEAASFGVSGTPAEIELEDFVDDEYPHVTAGTTVLVTITDHASHMANVCVVLTWTEG